MKLRRPDEANRIGWIIPLVAVLATLAAVVVVDLVSVGFRDWANDGR